ncbi:MAG TPA: CotH kinase family protein [Vicinamibacterales bacterium]|nr:CotH kinase family protein [Vicinamibacterales bacterium]
MRATLRTRLLLTATLAMTAVTARAQAPAALDSAALFDDSQLQEIRLVVNPRDWANLQATFQLNTYYAAHFMWRGQIVRNAGIRSRGTGSRSGTKPGLRVDFNRFDPTQEFLGLKSVILRNHVQDPSQLHERIAMRLFARAGVAAPRQAHVRLYVNDAYAGLYSVVESVDKDFLRDRFGQDGGYLYEYENDPGDAPYRFEDRGPQPSAYSPKPFDPVTHELDPDARPIADMVRAIAKTPDADFLRVLSGFIDLEGFVAHVAVEAFLAEIDGVLGDWGMNNFYVYRFEGTARSTLVPWDKSEAFKGGVSASIWRNVDDVPPENRNALMVRAMREPALRAVFLDTLLRCADIAGTGWLELEIGRAADQIRESVREDAAAPFPFDEFEEDVQRLLDFARSRSDIVREDVRRSPR